MTEEYADLFQREYPDIETFEEFTERWRAARTRSEILGLLHAGPRLRWAEPGRGMATNAPLVQRMIHFYIQCCVAYERSDEWPIAKAANENIVNGWLPRLPLTLFELQDQPGYIPVHLELLGFFKKLRVGITRAPYSIKIAKYLLDVYRLWSGADPPRDPGKMRPGWRPHEQDVLWHHTELVVECLFAWGLVEVVAAEELWKNARRPDVLAAISKIEQRETEKHWQKWLPLTLETPKPIDGAAGHGLNDEVQRRLTRTLAVLREAGARIKADEDKKAAG